MIIEIYKTNETPAAKPLKLEGDGIVAIVGSIMPPIGKDGAVSSIKATVICNFPDYYTEEDVWFIKLALIKELLIDLVLVEVLEPKVKIAANLLLSELTKNLTEQSREIR